MLAFAICNIIFMVLSGGIAFWAKEAVEPSLLVAAPLPVVKDLIRDWDAVPFYDVKVRPECASDEEPVFTRLWYGTERGCETDDSDFVAPRDTWKDNGKKLADCTEVLAVAPIRQGAGFPNGQRICGKRGGKSFAQVTRPDAETGACPSGTSACAASTSPENTVCYPKAEHATSCPITSLLVGDEAGMDALGEEYASPNGGKMTIEEGVSYLAYSKTVDGLPLSLTHVGVEAPCRDAAKAREEQTSWYPLELGREREICEAADADTRYSKADLVSIN